LLWIYRGATLYTTVRPVFLHRPDRWTDRGKLTGDSAEKSISGSVDLDSVAKLNAALEAHGIPNLQVVYFPGIDSFAHLSKDPLSSPTRVPGDRDRQGRREVLDEYRKLGALDETYVMSWRITGRRRP